jgi:hypothetical protein
MSIFEILLDMAVVAARHLGEGELTFNNRMTSSSPFTARFPDHSWDIMVCNVAGLVDGTVRP